MTDDDKPPISLAAERKQRERDFTAERELLIKELLEIGQSPERAAAIAQDMLYYDWLCLQATVILERWDLEPTAEATGRLVEIMGEECTFREGVESWLRMNARTMPT